MLDREKNFPKIPKQFFPGLYSCFQLLAFSTGERTSFFGNPMAKWWGYKWWWTRCLLSVFTCLICFIRSQRTSNLSSSTGFTCLNFRSPLLFQVPVCQGCRHKIFMLLDIGHVHFHLFRISEELNILFYSFVSTFNVKWLSRLCLQPHGTREGVKWPLLSLLGATFSRELELDKVIGD